VTSQDFKFILSKYLGMPGSELEKLLKFLDPYQSNQVDINGFVELVEKPDCVESFVRKLLLNDKRQDKP